jgi:hypothetical protein
MQDLSAEGAQLRIEADNVDRVLMARLVEEAPVGYPFPPVPYLLSCYDRLQQLSMKLPDAETAITAVKHIVVSHVWLTLSDAGVIPQPSHLEEKPAYAQLWDALWKAVPHDKESSQQAIKDPSVWPLPPGFLRDSCADCPEEVLGCLTFITEELRKLSLGTSILGDVTALDACWLRLMESKELAVMLTQTPNFAPKCLHGRDFQNTSPLASLLAISYIPDEGEALEPKPSVVQGLWANFRSQPTTAQRALIQEPTSKHFSVLMLMFSPKALLSKDARVATVQWIGSLLASETEKTKLMGRDVNKCLSNGLLINVLRVLLALSAPFLTFSSGKASQHIDLRCGPSGLTQPTPTFGTVAMYYLFEHLSSKRSCWAPQLSNGPLRQDYTLANLRIKG